MISRAIVGYTGFVGSNLLARYKFDHYFNSKNFADAKNMEFDELYFCGTPAVKWYANKYPDIDLENIQKITDILAKIKTKKIILISTIDVYDNPQSQQTEDYVDKFLPIDVSREHKTIKNPYGQHRLALEDFIKRTFTNYLIIRLPALIGRGLKKNIIYDLLNNNQINNISSNSQFQWYDLEWLRDDIDSAIKNNIQICNFVTEPVNTIDILNLFKNPMETYKIDSPIRYDVKTKYSKEFKSTTNGYIRDKNTVLNSIKNFVEKYNISKTNLVVSNICVKRIHQFQFACILKLFGINNVQIAPSLLIDNWSEMDQINFYPYTQNQINVYSFQSIAYRLDHLNIFSDTRDKLMTHLKNVVDCAHKNNIHVLVFGCPKNRHIINFTYDNENVFIEFFKELGSYCTDKKVVICIEPNSKTYGCNFLNKIKEVGDVVKKINNDNIRMMVDSGNATMEDDNFEDMIDYVDIIYNIDISQPKMFHMADPNFFHQKFKENLKHIKYNQNINLEMVINALSDDEELDMLHKSLDNFINLYGKKEMLTNN